MTALGHCFAREPICTRRSTPAPLHRSSVRARCGRQLLPPSSCDARHYRGQCRRTISSRAAHGHALWSSSASSISWAPSASWASFSPSSMLGGPMSSRMLSTEPWVSSLLVIARRAAAWGPSIVPYRMDMHGKNIENERNPIRFRFLIRCRVSSGRGRVPVLPSTVLGITIRLFRLSHPARPIRSAGPAPIASLLSYRASKYTTVGSILSPSLFSPLRTPLSAARSHSAVVSLSRAACVCRVCRVRAVRSRGSGVR
jgi:hypothetical protein